VSRGTSMREPQPVHSISANAPLPAATVAFFGGR
jgi:hypothetical protein